MFLAAHTGLRKHAAYRDGCGVGPVFGALLGPQRMFHPHLFVRGGNGRDLATCRIDQESAGSAGADIDSKPEHGSHQSSTSITGGGI